MLNYMKSEFYRVFYTKGVYIGIGCLMSMVLIGNIVINYFGGRYSNTSFSYSILVANPMIFVAMGVLVTYLLYEDGKKNGNLKNTVSSGISWTNIFIGKCVVSIAIATILMALTLLTWIAVAEAMLKKAGPIQMEDLLLEVPAVYLIAVASLISEIVFIELIDKIVISILLWTCIWFAVPKMLLYLGMRIEFVFDIALWLPTNFFSLTNGQHVNLNQCLTFWEMSGGLLRCICSGVFGILIFSLIGILKLRKKEF